MMTEALLDKQLWRLLWANTARQVIDTTPSAAVYEIVSAGYGWGLRCHTNRKRALLVHPTSSDSEIGDLSLTVLGVGTHVLPRCNRGYIDYLADVRDIVETTAKTYLTD